MKLLYNNEIMGKEIKYEQIKTKEDVSGGNNNKRETESKDEVDEWKT